MREDSLVLFTISVRTVFLPVKTLCGVHRSLSEELKRRKLLREGKQRRTRGKSVDLRENSFDIQEELQMFGRTEAGNTLPPSQG